MFDFINSSYKNYPVSFYYNEQKVTGLPENSEKTVTKTKGYTLIKTVGSFKELTITSSIILYDNFSVSEFMVKISNQSEGVSGIIKDFKIYGELPAKNPTLIYNSGDDMTVSGSYNKHSTKINNGVCLYSIGGYSCVNTLPYFRLISKKASQNVAFGYSGEWTSEFYPTKNSTAYYCKQKFLETYLEKGESLVSPRLTVMDYVGKEQEGRNLWRKFYYENILIKDNNEPLKPLLFLHTWQIDNKPEFLGITTKNQLTAIDEYLKKGLKPDFWWIDAGWYPCANNTWFNVGTWSSDKERINDDLKEIGAKLKQEDIGLLLWFEPERVTENTELFKEHKEWLLPILDKQGNVSDQYILNFANKDAVKWITLRVDNIIKTAGVKFYRQDHNTFIERAIIRTNVQKRVGITENMHIQGVLEFWDELKRLNPDLLFDECCAGGRRNDLEFMRRSVPLNYTDVGIFDYPIRQQHTFTLYEWFPYFRMHTPKNTRPIDEFAYINTITPSITCFVEYYDNEKQFNLAKKFLPIWRKLANIQMNSNFYPLTTPSKSNDGWYAVQFDNEKEGYVQVIRNEMANKPKIKLNVYADTTKTYKFTNEVTGDTFIISGEELIKKGLTVKTAKRSGKLLYYKTI